MPSFSDLLFWNRIEPHPRSLDLQQALKAEIRDPLWMLSRQWQFGEFKGEDAGKATSIKVNYQKHHAGNIQGRDANQTVFDFRNQPLESIVERTAYEPDLFTRIEIGRQWFRYLEKYLSETPTEELISVFEESTFLQFKLPEQFNKYQRYEQADTLGNAAYMNVLETLVKEKKIDGGILINIISDRYLLLSEYILGYENAEIDILGERLLNWAQRVYNVNIGKNTFWSASQLEHQFEIEIPVDEETTKKLHAEEYYGGQMDWYQYDMTCKRLEEGDHNHLSPETYSKIFPYPSEVKYKGMAHSRWWTLEDNTVNFGNIKAHSANPATLIFSQFSLIFSNDWLMMPFDIEMGTLCQIVEMIVTDNFGIQTLVKHIHDTAPDENWGLFQLHDRDYSINQQNDTALFIPPIIDDLQKSKPVEEINFLRDEMANMVWGVEKTVPDHLGNGLKGSEMVSTIEQYLRKIEEPVDHEVKTNEAKVQYQLATPVPENWIPFIPVHIKNQNLPSRQIQLQRASMPRVVNGYKPSRVRPKTSLLSSGLKGNKRRPFYIHEEEIPRSGAIIKGQWKRTRWLNGQTIIWYAYEKTNGRGEGNSGLKFDHLRNKKA